VRSLACGRFGLTAVLLWPLVAGCAGAFHHDTSEAAGFDRSTSTLAGPQAHLRQVVLRNNGTSVRYDAPASDAIGGAKAVLPIVAYRRICPGPTGDDTGLTTPTLSVSVDSGASGPAVVTFGSRNFTGAGVYTSIGSDSCVYLTPVAEVERLAALVDEQTAHSLYRPTGPSVSALLDQQESQNEQPENNPWLSQSQHKGGD
jgi:hypothetical protein